MKKFLLPILAFFALEAQASLLELNCSSATGKFSWKITPNENHATLHYDGFAPGSLTVELHKLNINYLDRLTLKEEAFNECGSSTVLSTYAARVIIAPSENYPDALLSYFPEGQISTSVICESVVHQIEECIEETKP